ncbi:MAG: hypothetical protein K2X66_01450 [Cyanobacteria bacterium]|nr:hypothetical protein [Cyanobacteriota bacterium]
MKLSMPETHFLNTLQGLGAPPKPLFGFFSSFQSWQEDFPAQTKFVRRFLSVYILCFLWLTLPVGAKATFSPGDPTNPGSAKASSASPSSAYDPRLVKVSANQQTFDGTNSKTYLKGNVDVTYKDVRIRGSEAIIDDDGAGNPSVANFFKRPLARRIVPLKGEDTLHADIIRLFLKENAMSAEGNTVTYVTTMAADPFTIRADTQQFDNISKNVVARGQVEVNYKDTKAFSPRAILQVGPNGKAEKVVFSGGARIEQESSIITGEKVTVMVGSGNMIAEQNVKTTYSAKDPKTGGGGSQGMKILIDSDYQQYDKVSQTILASGNVRIVYDTYIATGPKATFKMKDGAVDQIILTGRPSIIELDRKIVADKITIITNPKHFDAFGNVKTQFQAKDETAAPPPAVSTEKPSATSGKPSNDKSGAAKPKKSPVKKPEPDLINDY